LTVNDSLTDIEDLDEAVLNWATFIVALSFSHCFGRGGPV
jgi:hypothetical protein